MLCVCFTDELPGSVTCPRPHHADLLMHLDLDPCSFPAGMKLVAFTSADSIA